MSLFRHPKTTQEARAARALLADRRNFEEFPVMVRVRRAGSGSGLPSAYDDIPRSSYEVRSWKSYRKNQWRKKGSGKRCFPANNE